MTFIHHLLQFQGPWNYYFFNLPFCGNPEASGCLWMKVQVFFKIHNHVTSSHIKPSHQGEQGRNPADQSSLQQFMANQELPFLSQHVWAERGSRQVQVFWAVGLLRMRVLGLWMPGKERVRHHAPTFHGLQTHGARCLASETVIQLQSLKTGFCLRQEHEWERERQKGKIRSPGGTLIWLQKGVWWKLCCVCWGR